MNTIRICQSCGTAMPSDAPEGLCPQCLMKGAPGAGEESSLRATEIANQKSKIANPTAPPKPAEIAQHFPQLEIIELLGQGGMGIVYKARQPHLDRLVALKVLTPEVGRDPSFAERFAREAKALAKLNHPNIVAVYEFGQAGDYYYFLMELVDGVNLRQLEQSRRLTPQEALSIVPKICEALQYAHDEGIVHRDIKPGNILMDKKGRVKIADFGLAKLVGKAPADLTLTHSHQVMGTPHYMAPEQMEKPQTVDHRADIYSLGVVFYEMLTGELPMGRFAPPSQKVQVDVRVDEVVLHSLERDVERRYQHVSEVKTDVETIARESPPSSGEKIPPVNPVLAPASEQSQPLTPRFSRKALMGVAWAFFAVPAALLFIAFTHWLRANPPPLAMRWLWLLAFLFLLPVATAPFGTTILGIVSLHDIRHSRGRIVGLGLALADALLFPLLALDALILALWLLIWRTMA